MAEPIRVVIVGGGTAGWMCAAALARLLDPDRYALRLIESDDIATVGVGEATLPHLKRFNEVLGLNERDVMRATQATFKLGIEFAGWGRAVDRYIHPFGTFGESWGGLDFQHHYTHAVRSGLNPDPFQSWSFAVEACRAGRFEFPDEDAHSIRSTYDYAYHFDAGLYARYLRRWSTARGVVRHEGEIVEVALAPDSGRIEAVTLKSGLRIAGDVFVDCSGFRALLLGNLGAQWEDWTHWLPCDRAWAMPSLRSDAVQALRANLRDGQALRANVRDGQSPLPDGKPSGMPPYTIATAQTAGWTWRIPLQHRTGNGYVFSSAFTDEDSARETLLSTVDRPISEPKRLRFAAGRRTTSWVGNCIAIGLSSGFLEPLESTSIYLIQQAILALSELMPASLDNDPRLADEFNRRVAVEYDRVRDFLILHYHANGRTGEAMWDHCRHMAIPDSLAHRIDLFRTRGHVPFYKDGLFARDSWLAVLMGQDVTPHACDSMAAAVSPLALQHKLEDLRGRIDGRVAAMTAHSAFVATYCAAMEEVA